MILRPLDVIWILDQGAYNPRTDAPGKWKPVVAMVPGPPDWVFFRINSRHHEGRHGCHRLRPGSIALARADHPFLDHDSFLYCGGPPVALDEGQLADAVSQQRIPERRGVVGRIALFLLPEIRTAVGQSEVLTEETRDAILAALTNLG